MKLYNFTGTCVSDLKRAIKLEEELPTAASLLKLSVGKPGGEKEDLDLLEDLDENEVFDFKTLCLNYEITKRNPICVELPR